MIIVWKIRCINNDVYEQKSIVSYGAQGQQATEVRVKKLFDRIVYVDTDKLLPRNHIAIDIALERYTRLNDPSFFHVLRPLFMECNNDVFTSTCDFMTFTDSNYHEDQNGKYLTSAQFVESMHEPMIRQDLGEFGMMLGCEGGSLNIEGLMTPMYPQCFSFSDDQISILNQFVRFCFMLMHSSAVCSPAAGRMTSDAKGSKVTYNISDEQYNSSLMVFRNLYMKCEPASFSKVMVFLSSEDNVKHPIINYFKSCQAEFDYLCQSGPLNFPFLAKFFKAGTLWQPENVSGDKLIRYLLYMGRFHQPDKKNYREYDFILRNIPDESVVEYMAFCVFQKMSACIVNAGICCLQILKILGRVTIDIPMRRISDTEKHFYLFIRDQCPRMAHIIWQEQGCPLIGELQFYEAAWTEILKMFPFDLDALQYLRTLKPSVSA